MFSTVKRCVRWLLTRAQSSTLTPVARLIDENAHEPGPGLHLPVDQLEPHRGYRRLQQFAQSHVVLLPYRKKKWAVPSPFLLRKPMFSAQDHSRKCAFLKGTSPCVSPTRRYAPLPPEAGRAPRGGPAALQSGLNSPHRPSFTLGTRHARPDADRHPRRPRPATSCPASPTATASSPAPRAPARRSRCRSSPSACRQLGVPIFMADVKGDLAGMSQPGKASPKLDERLKQIGADKPAFAGFPVDVLGPLRRAGPSGAGHGLGHGTAAPRPHPQSQRNAGRRAHARVQDRRRQRAAAARPQGLARAAAACGGQRARNSRPTTATCPPRRSAPSSAGSSRSSSKAPTSSSASRCSNVDDLLQTVDGKGVDQHPRRRPPDAVAEGLLDAARCGCWRSCTSACPKSAIATSRSSCSSSTRRTCCSPMRRSRCSRRSSRSCGSSGRRAWACSS